MDCKRKVQMRMAEDKMRQAEWYLREKQRAERKRREAFDKLLLERWIVRQEKKNGGVRAPRPTEGLGSDGQIQRVGN